MFSISSRSPLREGVGSVEEGREANKGEMGEGRESWREIGGEEEGVKEANVEK